MASFNLFQDRCKHYITRWPPAGFSLSVPVPRLEEKETRVNIPHSRLSPLDCTHFHPPTLDPENRKAKICCSAIELGEGAMAKWRI